ncbi:MAG: Gfo/Idh/MocA family protein [Lachnospiraceae bacterium]
MGKLKAGIIGCGGIANNKHLPAITELGEVDVVAFCDIILERAESTAKKFSNPETTVGIFADYQELLKTDLDIVYVCTPNRSHCKITVDALKNDKHVLCEKPMAMNYEEACLMRDTAKETGKILSIAYQNRYRADSQYLKAECSKGTLGDIYFAKAHAIRRRAVPTWGVFLNEFEQGGGPLIDIGTHALDLTLWQMDNYEPEYVVGTTYHKLNKQTQTGNAWGDWDTEAFSVEDSAFGFIKMKNGATIMLESSWALNSLDVDEAKTSLCGTLAGADMKDGLRINYIKNNTQVVEKPTFAAPGVDFYDGEGDDPALLEQKTFVHAVKDEGELCVLPNQAAVVTQILEAIYESAKTGAPVYFK